MSEMRKRKDKPWVLVIDDEEYRQERIRHLLGDAARVSVARSAGQAIGMLRRDRYDVVLLDCDLSRAPEGYGPRDRSGMDVAQVLAESPNRRSIVVVTSHGQSSAGKVTHFLEENGVKAERCRFANLTAELLADVLADVTGKIPKGRIFYDFSGLLERRENKWKWQRKSDVTPSADTTMPDVPPEEVKSPKES